MSRAPIVAAALVVLALAALVVSSLRDEHHTTNRGALPTVSHGIPTDYRILYEVTTPDGTTTEEHVVHRPFGAEVVERDANGKVTSERWSSLGSLVTRSQGAPAVALRTAVAPSVSDERPDVLAAPLTEAGRLTAAGTGEVGGRPCTLRSQPDKVATAPPSNGSTPVTNSGTLAVVVTSCTDAQGLVLEERWASAAKGDRLLTKRAIELDIGSSVPAVHVPRATQLPQAQGNGAIHRLRRDQPVPFARAFSLPTPKGFTFVGRYAVVPARLSTGGALPADAGVALYTDVWRRGPDVLLLDQGASKDGGAPFDASTAIGPVNVSSVGPATLAMDLRLAEVRFTLPDGGFARLAGTIDPKALVALADTLTVTARR